MIAAVVLSGGIGIGLGSAAAGSNSAGPEGVWETQNTAHVEIRQCGRGYCGIVVKPVEPGHFDEKNPDPSLRNRPIQNLPILWVSDSDNPAVWEGEVYNPEVGRTFVGKVQMKSNNELELKGCLQVLSSICHTHTWKRVR